MDMEWVKAQGHKMQQINKCLIIGIKIVLVKLEVIYQEQKLKLFN
jgi:hypothetical protein